MTDGVFLSLSICHLSHPLIKGLELIL